MQVAEELDGIKGIVGTCECSSYRAANAPALLISGKMPFLHRAANVFATFSAAFIYTRSHKMRPAITVAAMFVTTLALAEPQYFEVSEHQAFIIEPSESSQNDGPTPWVFYAPTFARRLPGPEEDWMIQRFLDSGIAIAGIDVGESYGNPKGRAAYQELYEELTSQRGYSKRPVLLARSRGGLMLYNWAVEHPDCVAGIAGIYPVCNIESYPGVAKAAHAYEMTAEQLQSRLTEHNPINRLAPLANAKVPILHIHGDQDRVVPLERNSAELASNYRNLGGSVTIEVIRGQGHNMWKGWFQSEQLTDFVISRALATTKTPPNSDSAELSSTNEDEAERK